VRQRRLAALFVCAGTLAFVNTGALGSGSQREGGIFRVVFAGLDYVDPALAYGSESWALLDTTCARLMTYPDKPAPAGLSVVPEVAADYPKISRNGKTYTFTLRSGFRFSDGTPVRATAFARAINRTLAKGIETAAVQYTGDIVGAADVEAGKTSAAAGVTARGNTLVVRFTRPVVNFAAITTMPFFCAVPPTLPSDPEGVGVFPSAGPYVITEYRPGERVTIRRNRFYRGTRPHHVDGFDVDLRSAGFSELLDRVEAGEADWGAAPAPVYFEPGRGLAGRFGVNKSQFFVRPGYVLKHLVFNTSRPLFRDNAASGPFFSKLFTPGEPWDLAPLFWAPDFIDPFQYTNLLFDPQFASIGNVGRFDSRTFNSQMRRAARLVGSARYRTYADLDVRLARDAAPSAPISFLNEATLVSKRVGCVVLRPTLDLTAVCLK
jgi:ABC-type oligopeptide transport system substrate-binding subunit